MAPVVFARSTFRQIARTPTKTEPGSHHWNLVVVAISWPKPMAGCYRDGVVYSCTPPAPMTLPFPFGSGGSGAGGNTVCPLIGPCHEPAYNLDRFSGDDRN